MAIHFVKKGERVLSVPCHKQLNLLAHAQMEGLHIGSECGGHGVCGKDILRIRPEDKAHFSPPTAAEKKHMGEGVDEGWRMGCQTYPASDDLDVEVEFGLT